MRASPMVVFPSITREEGSSMHKRKAPELEVKAPEEEVVLTRTLANASAGRWVRVSQE